MSAGQEVGDIFGMEEGAATSLLRSPIVLIASIGFWGMNIYFFRRIGIDHVRVLLLDLVKEREEKAAKAAQQPAGAAGTAATEESRSTAGSGKLARARRKRGLPPKRTNSSDGGTSGEDQDDGGDGGASASSEHHRHHDTSDKQSDCGEPDDDELALEMTNLDPEGRLTQTAAGQRHSHGVAMGGNSDTFMDEETVSTMTNGTQGRSSASSSPGAGHDSDQTGGKGTPSKTLVSSSSTVADELKAPTNEVTSVRCFIISIVLLILLFSTNYVWLNVLGGGTIGAVFSFYALVTIGIVTPLQSTRWVRVAVKTALLRVAELLNPRCSCLGGELRPIPFVDVFVADAMCSLSKVFFDWGMLLHLASHYPDPVPPSVHAIIIPSIAASWPYVCRARQCLIMHRVGKLKNDPKRYQHLLNALKYSSSLFPLCVSAYQKTIDETKAAQVDKILITLIVINSLYCLAWDIVMDWGMLGNPMAVVTSSCLPAGSAGVAAKTIVEAKGVDWTHHCLRPRLRFGLGMSLSILVADCFLRFAWLLRFIEHVIFPTNGAYILWTQLLEAFRRAIWNLLRVEWENIKQSRANKKRVSNRFEGDEETPFIAPPPKSISLSR